MNARMTTVAGSAMVLLVSMTMAQSDVEKYMEIIVKQF